MRMATSADFDNSERISLAYRDLDEIPASVVEGKSKNTRELDLSHNKMSLLSDMKTVLLCLDRLTNKKKVIPCDLQFLQEFENLSSLVLDNNHLSNHVKFPYLDKLETLWVNHNNITNLSVFIETVARSFPHLKYFSMMHNHAAPSYFNGGTYQQYKDYRFYVISHLPSLLVLDNTPITVEEREEARKVYGNRRFSIKAKKIKIRKEKKTKN